MGVKDALFFFLSTGIVLIVLALFLLPLQYILYRLLNIRIFKSNSLKILITAVYTLFGTGVLYGFFEMVLVLITLSIDEVKTASWIILAFSFLTAATTNIYTYKAIGGGYAEKKRELIRKAVIYLGSGFANIALSFVLSNGIIASTFYLLGLMIISVTICWVFIDWLIETKIKSESPEIEVSS